MAQRPSVSTTGSHRVPAQDRGQRRLEEILDAAELVIADGGVDQATTNAIAERAGSGMGSLYHFFPNKDAIVQALGERYTAQMAVIFAEMRSPEMATITVSEMVNQIVDPLVAFHRRTPAYRHVYHAINRPGTRALCQACLQQGIVAWVEQLIATRAPATNPRLQHVRAVVSVEMVHRMLDFVAELPAGSQREVVPEIKRLLALYCTMMESGEDPIGR
jgi:AcrR family transcriptional regulator